MTKCAVTTSKTRKQTGQDTHGLASERNMADAKARQKPKLSHDHRQTGNKYLSGQLPTSSGVRESCPNRSSALVNRRQRIIDEKTWCDWRTDSSSINNTA